MSVEVSAGLGKVSSDNLQALAEVTIAIKGIPEKAKDKDQYAFSAEIVMQGVYTWPQRRPSNLNDKDLTNQLCQPLYVMAVTEITRLVNGTGMGRITLPWTIDDNGDRQPHSQPSAKKRAAPRKAIKAATKAK